MLFEVVTVVSIKITVCWSVCVMLCTLVHRY